jgi:hypothetical protein
MYEWYFEDNDLYESIVIFMNGYVIHCKLAWTIMDNSNYFQLYVINLRHSDSDQFLESLLMFLSCNGGDNH